MARKKKSSPSPSLAELFSSDSWLANKCDLRFHKKNAPVLQNYVCGPLIIFALLGLCLDPPTLS